MRYFSPYIVLFLLLCGCSSLKLSSTDTVDLPPLRESEGTTQRGDALAFHQAVSKKDFQDAIKIYKQSYLSKNVHNFPLLHTLCLEALKDGLLSSNQGTRLVSLFASSIAHSSHLLPILNLATNSDDPQIQLAGLQSTISLADSRRDPLIIDALRSNSILVRLEALSYLAATRHPNAFEHVESLMHKLPHELSPYFGYLFAQIGTQESISTLQRLLSSPKPLVRAHALVAIARSQIGALLPSVQSALSHVHPAELEGAACAIGALGDESAIERLKELSQSKAPHLALAALKARSQLGDTDAIDKIASYAQKGNLAAVGLLADSAQTTPLLLKLAKNPDREVQLAAGMALLKLKRHEALDVLFPIITATDTGFAPEPSLAGTFEWVRILTLNTNTFQKYPGIMQSSQGLIYEILLKASELGDKAFIPFAKQLIFSGVSDLISPAIKHLTLCQSPEAIDLLEDLSQTIGRPLIRASANLALFHLTKEAKYFSKIKAFALSELGHESLQLKPMSPTLGLRGEVSYELKAEEKTAIFLEALSVIAAYESADSIEFFLDAIEKAPTNLRCALCATLIRAMQ